jgi:hypothetical protein
MLRAINAPIPKSNPKESFEEFIMKKSAFSALVLSALCSVNSAHASTYYCRSESGNVAWFQLQSHESEVNDVRIGKVAYACTRVSKAKTKSAATGAAERSEPSDQDYGFEIPGLNPLETLTVVCMVPFLCD